MDGVSNAPKCMSTTLVVGASGATGQQVVTQLLNAQHKVKAIVRSSVILPHSWEDNPDLTVIRANVLDIEIPQMAAHLEGCTAVVSCLGHNLTLKGMFGSPRKLVKETVVLLSKAIQMHPKALPMRLVLMNTSGNRNKDATEPVAFSQKVLLKWLKVLLPPFADNIAAAEYLRAEIGQKNSWMEWVVVRPDALVDLTEVTPYAVYPSPIRSAIFNAGQTSRMNVGHFIAALVCDLEQWNKWKGQMPVVYNKTE